MGEQNFGGDLRDKGSANYHLENDPRFLDFKKVEVTKVDETKPWKPALEVKVTKADGTEEIIDANTPFFKFVDQKGGELTVSAAAAGHVDEIHISGQDLGSKFDYPDLQSVFGDAAKRMPPGITEQPGPSAFAVDMGKRMGKEGLASMAELLADGKINQADVDKVSPLKDEVNRLNLEGDAAAKQKFIDDFKKDNPDCRIQFQVVRGTVLVPTVDSPNRPTESLFMVFGPTGKEKEKTLWTAAPGRFMPAHPNPNQHKSQDGSVNLESFNRSADAWFDTVMLSGKE